MEAQPLSIKEEKPLPNFCKDCARVLGNRKHLEKAEDWKCNAEGNRKGVDLLTGATTLRNPSCREQRSRIGNDVCGPEGKWFQLYEYPKELYELPARERQKEKQTSLKSLTLDDI